MTKTTEETANGAPAEETKEQKPPKRISKNPRKPIGDIKVMEARTRAQKARAALQASQSAPASATEVAP